MPRSRRSLACVALAAFSVGCDHATKHVAALALEPGAAHGFWGELLRFELVRNPGAFMSLGAALAPGLREALLVHAAPVLLLGVCIAVLRSGPLAGREATGLALVVGGGIANWLDRLLNDGAVTDFVSIGVGSLRTGIFNLADVAIVAGALLLLSGGLTQRRARAT